MSGLKQHFPEFQFGARVTPDEIDRYDQYQVINPSISDVWFGTVSAATANAAYVLTNIRADYPRNVLFVALGVAGGMGGTAVVNGKNQFGEVITETLSFGSAAGGGTVAGTKIFAQVTSATFTPVGLGGTAVGTAKLGVAIGTSATTAFVLGLPSKIAATTDVKAITWSKEHVSTTLNGGTIAAYVNTAQHGFTGSAVMGGTEVYTVLFKSTYDNSGKANLAAL
jgi:hypothetical protein